MPVREPTARPQAAEGDAHRRAGAERSVRARAPPRRACAASSGEPSVRWANAALERQAIKAGFTVLP